MSRSVPGGASAAELAAATSVLRAQWATLHPWLRDVVDTYGLDALAQRPSALDGWSVAELVAHLARALSPLADAVELDPETVPLTLAEYLGTYPERADEIASSTRELYTRIAADPLSEVRSVVERALTRLEELGSADRVVQARRAPVLLSELIDSRLLEVVVHADDLHRSLPEAAGNPLNRDAVAHVAQTLLDIVVTRGGWSLEVVDPIRWIRLAAGRTPYDVDELARALQTQFTSDAVPDLGRHLPLF